MSANAQVLLSALIMLDRVALQCRVSLHPKAQAELAVAIYQLLENGSTLERAQSVLESELRDREVTGSSDFDKLSRSELLAKVRALDELVNSPHTKSFLESARLEAAHQVERWGTVHDRAKQPQDWFWLLGYLSGKALHAHANGDLSKALHHTVSSAAVLAHWHAAISQVDHRMTPGHSDLQAFLEQTFGSVP